MKCDHTMNKSFAARVMPGLLVWLCSLLFLLATPAWAAFSITKTSSPVFYTDSAKNLYCNYESFRVTSTTAVTDAWTRIDTFSSSLGSGSYEDGKFHFGSFYAGESKAAFFYVCSSFSGSTLAGQGYSVRIYDRDPALIGASQLASQSFSVSIDNTVIQANPNTVSVIFSGPNPGVLGGIITMVVEGDTGTIGCVNPPSTCAGAQAGPLAFTAASLQDWRADAYEMIGSNIALTGGNSGSYDNQLYIPVLSASSTTSYKATYYFRAASTTSVTTTLSPIGYIASGTQIKHTSTTNGAYSGAGLLPIEPATNTLTVSDKLVSDATLPAQGGRVTYTIRVRNSGSDPANLDSIYDTLPAGVSYVAGSSSFSGVALPDPVVSGSDRIWSSSFSIPANGTRDLVFQADIAAAPGTYVNQASARLGSTIIDTTLSTGDYVPALATTVVLSAPVIAKSFTPTARAVNGSSQMVITLTNNNAAHALNSVSFTDTYPAGLININPAGVVTSCAAGTLTVSASSIVLTGAFLPAGSSCTVTADTTSASPATYTNTTGTVTSSNGGTGNSAAAGVTFTTLPTISKSFAAATIPVGGVTTLNFVITNNGSVGITSLVFTDLFPSGLVLASPTALTPVAACGGTVESWDGTTASALAAGAPGLRLTGGVLATAGGSCTFSVNVTAAAAANYDNTTSGVSSSLGTTGPVSNTASLRVLAPLVPAKSFSPSTIGRGQSSRLIVTLTNPNPVAITGAAFTDTYPANLLNAAVPSPGGSCGGIVTAAAGGGSLVLSGGTIPASGSCTVETNVTSDVVNVSGYVNTLAAGAVSSGNAGSSTVPASATLIVNATPTLTKSFSLDVAAATTTMTLTITNNHTAGISGLSFTDVFPSGMLVDSPLTGTTSCGGTLEGWNGSTASTLAANAPGIRLTGGAIAGAYPASCSITLRIRVTSGGVYQNQTSGVAMTAPFTGTGSVSNIATLIAPIVIKTFTPNTVGANDLSRMELQITNPSPSTALTGLAISDTYPAGNLSTGVFMQNAPTPNATSSCGGTLTAAASTSSLSLAGGSLAAGQSCLLAVDVRANPGTVPDTYYNVTGRVRSSQGIGSTAADALYIVRAPTITKSFLSSPVTLSAGSATSVMRLVLESNHTATINGVSFTDTFPAAPAQMRYVNTVSNGCGGTLTDALGAALVANSSVGLRLSAVTLTAGQLCTLDVTVSVPAAGTYFNQTSGATATTSGFTSPGPASNIASLVANLSAPTVSKSFAVAQAGVNVPVTMTIALTNPNTEVVTGVNLTDTYPGTLVNAPAPALGNSCGGSATAAAGTASLALVAGSIPASGSCIITVSVLASAAGALTNSTGAVISANANAATAATASITFLLPPTVAKSFSPASLYTGEASLLTITLTNPNALAISGAAFTDTYPAGLVNAVVPGAATTCSGGAVTAASGGSALALSGATLAASSSCTVTVSVRSTVAGVYQNNTGAVTTTNAGSGASASATLTVVMPLPALSVLKMVAVVSDPVNGTVNPKSIPGALSAYSIRITNSGPGTVDNNTLIVSDPLPTNVELFVGDFDGAGLGPVTFVDSTPGSGLSWVYTAPGNMTDGIDFSNDNGVTWTYVPVPDGNGFDSAVTHVRLKPQGVMSAAGATNPYAEFIFRVRIK